MNNAEEQYTLQAHSETKETFSEDNAEIEPQGKVIQLNLGSHARNSGGHYVEVSVPDSVKTFLTVTPSAQLDKMALDNERMFEARYGFRAGQAVRKQVIAMQQQYDLRFGAPRQQNLAQPRHVLKLIVRRIEHRIGEGTVRRPVDSPVKWTVQN